MNSKAFIWLLAAVLVVGGAIGGAFFTGLIIGKGGQTDLPVVTLTGPPGSAVNPSGGGGPESFTLGGDGAPGGLMGQGDVMSPAELEVLAASGADPNEVAAQIQRQIQEQLGGGGEDAFSAALGVQVGTVEAVDGNTLTLDTQQGPLEVFAGDETAIQMTVDVPLSDLETGMAVMVEGERGEDGTFTAGSIAVLPEGAILGGFPAGGFGGGMGGFPAGGFGGGMGGFPAGGFGEGAGGQ